MTRNFVFVIASTRSGGNSEHLARRAAHALSPDVPTRWLRLIDHPLDPFLDTRHSTGFTAPAGNAKLLCDATLAATDLVIVSPVYWYSLSWPAKLYLDHWSAWMRIPELAFMERMRGRNLWGVLVDSDTDPSEGSSNPVIDTLRRTAGYMSMQLRGTLVGHANVPGSIEMDAAALEAATRFFATS